MFRNKKWVIVASIFALIVILFAVKQMSPIRSVTRKTQGTAMLTWEPSKEKSVTGYKVYIESESGNFKDTLDVSKPDINENGLYQYTIKNLASGDTYFFYVTAYTNAGVESAASEKVRKKIEF